MLPCGMRWKNCTSTEFVWAAGLCGVINNCSGVAMLNSIAVLQSCPPRLKELFSSAEEISMRKAMDDMQLKLFPKLAENETRYSRALLARARVLQGYWMERVQGHARTPDVRFFIELCRRYSQNDVRCAIQITTARIRSSKLAWELAENDCRSTVADVVLKRAKQKIATVEAKRPVGSVLGARHATVWIQ